MTALTDEPLSATATRLAFATGTASAETLLQASLERIAGASRSSTPGRRSTSKRPRRQARRLDEARRIGLAEPRTNQAGAEGLLAGVPIGVKDLIDTADLPTRYGTAIYDGHRPTRDAACVSAALRVGAVLVGKTVTTELAYFTPGPTVNPRHPGHTPGGFLERLGRCGRRRHGAACLRHADAGSLIRPASFCGIFGLKPTFAAVDMSGIKPFAPSLDTLGWFARSAEDLELMRCALSGEPFTPWAALSLLPCASPHAAPMNGPLIDGGGEAAWHRGTGALREAGVPLPEVELPEACRGLFEAQKTVMAYEAARSLEPEWREHRQRLGAPLLALLELGRGIEDSAYRGAVQAGETGRHVIAEWMGGVDAVLAPSAPGEAPRGTGGHRRPGVQPRLDAARPAVPEHPRPGRPGRLADRRAARRPGRRGTAPDRDRGVPAPDPGRGLGLPLCPHRRARGQGQRGVGRPSRRRLSSGLLLTLAATLAGAQPIPDSTDSPECRRALESLQSQEAAALERVRSAAPPSSERPPRGDPALESARRQAGIACLGGRADRPPPRGRAAQPPHAVPPLSSAAEREPPRERGNDAGAALPPWSSLPPTLSYPAFPRVVAPTAPAAPATVVPRRAEPRVAPPPGPPPVVLSCDPTGCWSSDGSG
jgi:Asp-tRNA(Asn)/Glu-tRNA(Gln) amidotransferase A subunit family amidase